MNPSMDLVAQLDHIDASIMVPILRSTIPPADTRNIEKLLKLTI